ncbi:MAG: prenyltransferase [Candidatus Eisenbacteria bacterium]|nr:prenyltransferase [Candidatus Eisenbacteria bacterium]
MARGEMAGRQGRPGTPLRILLATRVHFWPVSILPVLVGSTLPFWLRPEGFVWSSGRFAVTLLAVLLIHIASNLANEYHDDRSAADRVNPRHGSLSGGSGLIQAGALPAGAFLAGAIACYAAAAGLGLWLNAVLPGNLALVLGVVGVLGGYFYTAPPLKLSHRGLGEVAVALLFGVLPVVGAYFVQARTVSWQVVVASLPLSFAVALVLWVNEIVDAVPDAAAGKATLVTRVGARAAGRWGVLALTTLAFASLFLAVFTASLIPLTLVAVLAFGLARTVVVDCWSRHARPADLAAAQRAALKLHAVLGVVIALSALVAAGG